MNEISYIEKAIEYLQSLKKQNAVVDKIEIECGWRYATPEDTNYCELAKTRVPDGSFVMRVYGEKNCSLRASGMGSANYKNNIMRDTTVTISELELDGETAFKIANCIKKHEPEIWKGLSKALKQALPIHDVAGQSEQLFCECMPDPACRIKNGKVICNGCNKERK